MTPRNIILIVVALAAGIGAVIMVRGALTANANANRPVVEFQPKVEVAKTDVLVANRNLQVGETLSQADMIWVSFPEDLILGQQITKELQPDAPSELNGHIVRIPIFEQEAILAQKLVARGETGIMAALVSPGMRAVAIEISAESASGGFILPEDRVDVILTHEVEVPSADGIIDEIQSLVLLGNVRVLAIDQGIAVSTENPTSLGSTATIELSPDDSALIALGERKGKLSLALRSLTDVVQAGDEVFSAADAFEKSSKSTGRVALLRNGRLSDSGSSRGE